MVGFEGKPSSLWPVMPHDRTAPRDPKAHPPAVQTPYSVICVFFGWVRSVWGPQRGVSPLPCCSPASLGTSVATGWVPQAGRSWGTRAHLPHGRVWEGEVGCLALLESAGLSVEQKLSGSHKALVEMQDAVTELLKTVPREYPATKVRVGCRLEVE